MTESELGVRYSSGFGERMIPAIDWNAVSAVAGWAAAVVAIGALWLQQRQSNFSTHLDSLWRLLDQFNGDDMVAKRATVAAQLLNGNIKENAQTDDILDFFDLIGYLIEKRALDKEAAWMMFSDAGCSYWYGSQNYMDAAKQKNPLYWEHYRPLVNVFLSAEMSKGGLKNREDAEARAKVRAPDFLQEEKGLGSGGLTQRSATAGSGRAGLARVEMPPSTPS